MKRQNPARQIGDADCVLELLWFLMTIVAPVRPRQDLVLETCCRAINWPS